MTSALEHLKALSELSQLGSADNILENAERILAERSLLEFIKQGWRYIAPNQFEDNWHIAAICEHLEAVARGEIRHLLINVPPRSMKSISCSVAFTPWIWAQKKSALVLNPNASTGLTRQSNAFASNPGGTRPPHPPLVGSHTSGTIHLPPNHLGPQTRFLCASYGDALSLQMSRDTRNLLNSPWYQKNWPALQISDDSNTKTRFDNSAGGYRIATSVGGSLTGFGGDIIIIDDAHNVKEVESEITRKSVLDWWTGAMSTRLNDPRTGSFIVVMQRVHEGDLAGFILDNADVGGDWTLLRIPMEYEPVWHCSTSIGWEDPRGIDEDGERYEGIAQGANGLPYVEPGSPAEEVEGELMWPERFGRKEVDALKKSLGSYVAAGQLQQRPVQKGGAIIKEDYWQLFPPKGDEAEYEKKVNVWDGSEYVDKVILDYPMMEYVVAYADTAYTEKEENDYSACAVFGVWRDKKDNARLMLMRCWQERMELNKLVHRIANTCQLSGGKNPSYVDRLIIENKASGKSVAQEIKRLYGNEKWVTETSEPKGDKVARAHSIQYLFEDKMVYAPAREWADLAIAECAKFPKGNHDDLPDAIFGGVRWLRDNGFIEMRRERVIRVEDTMAHRAPVGALYDV